MAGEEYDPGNPAHLVVAALDWTAGGEGEVPPVLRGLPDEAQAALLAGAHELAETVRERLAGWDIATATSARGDRA